MFNLKFIYLIATICGLLALAGCGQSGPLYLPPDSSLNSPATDLAGQNK